MIVFFFCATRSILPFEFSSVTRERHVAIHSSVVVSSGVRRRREKARRRRRSKIQYPLVLPEFHYLSLFSCLFLSLSLVASDVQQHFLHLLYIAPLIPVSWPTHDTIVLHRCVYCAPDFFSLFSPVHPALQPSTSLFSDSDSFARPIWMQLVFFFLFSRRKETLGFRRIYNIPTSS